MAVQSNSTPSREPDPDEDMPPLPRQRAVPDLPEDDIPELAEADPPTLPADEVADLPEKPADRTTASD